MVVNADFPFQSKFLTIDGSKIHYVEEGRGENPVLFLHGNPTSSYLWRNIIPIVAKAGINNRCIALDLIGFGKSDKPNIDYDFPPEFAKLLQAFRTQGSGYELIQVQNVFVEQVIPSAVFDKQNLSEAIMKHYREPFPTIESRKPIRRFPEMLPLDPNVEGETYKIIQKLEIALYEFKFPTLLIKGNPGAVIPESRVKWLQEKMPKLVVKDIGPGIHYLQEDNPEGIGNSILEWSSKIT